MTATQPAAPAHAQAVVTGVLELHPKGFGFLRDPAKSFTFPGRATRMCRSRSSSGTP